jgi:dTDP-4-dehydrorhamnose reductase
MPKRPKLIVTGLSGLLGSRMSHLAKGRVDLVGADIVEGVDITAPLQMLRIAEDNSDAEALIHLAAFTDVSAAFKQNGDASGLCWRLNVLGTRNVAAACEAFGIHMIHVSTDFVFDGAKTQPYVETDPVNPIEWYGQTKLEAEQAVMQSESWSMARIAFPYVPGGGVRPDLVETIRGKLASGQPAQLFDDQFITPTLADDIIEGLFLLARTRPQRELFHLTGSSSLSPYDLGQEIAKAFGLNSKLVQRSSLTDYLKKDPRPRQKSLRMCNEKWSAFAKEHGLGAPLTIVDGLRRCAESAE